MPAPFEKLNKQILAGRMPELGVGFQIGLFFF